jgi:exodeoxyribonuclease VII small subunit
MNAQPGLTFETAYAKLEEILEKMNSGKVALEESLHLYEEADQLIIWCSKRLTEAEKKIEILTKNRDAELAIDSTGKPETRPFAAPNCSPLTSGQT